MTKRIILAGRIGPAFADPDEAYGANGYIDTPFSIGVFFPGDKIADKLLKWYPNNPKAGDMFARLERIYNGQEDD